MKPRTAIGLGLAFSSILFFVGGALVLQNALDAKARSERQIAATNKQCLAYLNELPNVTVAPAGDDVTVVMRGITDPKTSLTDATLGIMMCPTKKVESVCVGDECQGANKEVIVRFKLIKG